MSLIYNNHKIEYKLIFERFVPGIYTHDDQEEDADVEEVFGPKSLLIPMYGNDFPFDVLFDLPTEIYLMDFDSDCRAKEGGETPLIFLPMWLDDLSWMYDRGGYMIHYLISMLPYDPGGEELTTYMLLLMTVLWVFDLGGVDSEIFCRLSWVTTLWPFDPRGQLILCPILWDIIL